MTEPAPGARGVDRDALIGRQPGGENVIMVVVGVSVWPPSPSQALTNWLAETGSRCRRIKGDGGVGEHGVGERANDFGVGRFGRREFGRGQVGQGLGGGRRHRDGGSATGRVAGWWSRRRRVG